MKLHEYLNQAEIKRQPFFSVEIEKKDIAAIWQVNEGVNVQLDICNDHLTYHCLKGETGPLYTLDKQPSCFKLV